MPLNKRYCAALLYIIFIQGCSFSTSSSSLSESSTSLSESISSIISSPSTSSDQEKDYEIQIMDYTTIYLSMAEFERASFAKGISDIAAQNGITHWEDNEPTLMGIGRALKKAKLTGSAYETFKKGLSDGVVSRMRLIQKGYEAQ